MAKVGSWNTTAANNNSTPPDGWPEGQAPSTVNDCAREMMAQIKTMVNNIEYIDLNNTPSFLTATTFSLATADTVNFTVGRRVKLGDGANTLYGTINSVSATFVSVQLDASANQLVLDSSLSTCALAIIRPDNSSLPENLWKRKNVIINGNMEIWQRSATFAINPTAGLNSYTADRWALAGSLSANTAANVTRFERSANASAVPTVLQAGALLDSSLIVSVSTIASVVAAGQWAKIRYAVEGYDFRQIAQRPMNLSFWVNTRQSGIYCVALRNTASNQSLIKEYTISAIATWTRFSIPLLKTPSGGTWDYSSGVGLEVNFTLACGSTFQGGAGNWTAAALLGTSNQVNFFQSAGNTFAITGVQLEEGSFATPLEVRPYQTEKELCTRYWQAVPDDAVAQGGYIFGWATSTSGGDFKMDIPEMRAAPTVAYPTVGNINILAQNGAAQPCSAISTLASGPKYVVVLGIAQGTPLIAGSGSSVFIGVGSKIELTAEL